MEAAIFKAPFALNVSDQDRPRPAPGEALVRVRAAGLCPGDLYIYLGRNPYVSYPRIGGHEISGDVVALGPETAGPAAGTLFITDIAEERLGTAADLGATPLRGGEGILDEVMRATGGEGMPVVIEATGNVQAMESTVDLVAAGGRIVIVGLVKKGTMVAFPGLDFTRKEMTIVGSRASVNCFPESLDLIARGAIRYPEIACTFRFAEAPRVFGMLAENHAALHKAVFLTEAA